MLFSVVTTDGIVPIIGIHVVLLSADMILLMSCYAA